MGSGSSCDQIPFAESEFYKAAEWKTACPAHLHYRCEERYGAGWMNAGEFGWENSEEK